MPDDLRTRIAEALMRWAERNNSPRYAPIRRPETVTRNAYDRADAVLAVVQPELDRRDRYQEQLRGMRAWYRDSWRSAARERDRYRSAWQSARRERARLRGIIAANCKTAETFQDGGVNDIAELYRAQDAIQAAGGQLTRPVHRAIDAIRAKWDRVLRSEQQKRADAEASIARVRRYCELTAGSCRVQAREMAIDVLQIIDGKKPHEVLIDRTSCGAPDVRLIAARTSPEDVERILRRARGLDDDDRPNPPYDLPDGFRAGAGGEQ